MENAMGIVNIPVLVPVVRIVRANVMEDVRILVISIVKVQVQQGPKIPTIQVLEGVLVALEGVIILVE